MPLPVLGLITLTACAPGPTTATATEAALCLVWGQSLATRSHRDTAQTKDEIEAGYAIFARVCPSRIALIPRGGTE